MNAPLLAFEPLRLTLPIEKVLPIRVTKDPGKVTVRYAAILASIKEVGVIEPLMVFPQKGNPGFYQLVDGHFRLAACQELGKAEVDCLVSTDDEGFTYNARINRLAPIQERQMILKAVESGLSIERIAKVLNLKASDIKTRLNMTEGIAEEAVERLKDKQIGTRTFRLLKQVLPVRQVEIADLMTTANNYSRPYLEALIFGTPKELMAAQARKKKKALKPEEIARMENEMESLQAEYRACEQTFSASMLQLTVFRRYIMKLLENAKVKRFLMTRHPEIHAELADIVANETI